jgi:lipopolysaccharide heptosyltransferase II
VILSGLVPPKKHRGKLSGKRFGSMNYKIINRKKRIAVKTIDFFLRPLFFIREKTTGQHKAILAPADFPKIKKILILRTAYIGDVVMTLPALTPLRAAFPNAELSFLTSYNAAPILANHPAIDKIIPYDAFWFYSQPKKVAYRKYQEVKRRIQQEQFDLVIDFRGDLRDIFFLAYRSQAKYRISYGSGGGAYWLTQVVPLKEKENHKPFDSAQGKHRVPFHLNILRELNIPVSDDIPKIYLTEAEKQNAFNKLNSLGLNPNQDIIIGIHPGARMPLKRWEPNRYAELINRISQSNLGKVVLFTTPEFAIADYGFQNAEFKNAPAIMNNLNLRDLAAVLSYCRVLICNDSAPMHIAAAVGSKCLAIFGPSKSNETGPYGPGHSVIENPYSCRPTCDEATCNYTIYNDCLKTITIETVFQSLEKIIRT